MTVGAGGARVRSLCFHGIGAPQRPLEAGEERFWISRDTFQSILDVVAEDSDVDLSFDDSNSSDVQYALPDLTHRGLSATFYVLAGRLDKPGSLAAADVRTLRAAGMTLGSHGMNHVPWRDARTPAERQEELVAAREALEEAVGDRVTWAACPFGSYDRSVLRALKRLGYERLCTVEGGTSRKRSWIRDRYTVTRFDDATSIRSRLQAPDGTLRESARRRFKGLVKRWR